jgi:hypothetical protein
MKVIYKSIIAVLLVFSVSCSEKIDEINVNPDTFPTANDAQVLSASIGFLGYIQDVDLNMFSFLWAQYYTWGIGVSIGNQERYVSEPDDFDGYWERAYANCLIDLKFLTKSESPAYRGVARILQAYIYQGLVDHFGNVPYSDAISGEIEEGGVLTPTYDDAATIYSSLIATLDEALAELDVAADGEIGDDDLIYGGDLDAWVKFGNSLKLRMLMRTSEVNPQGPAVQALINSGSFIEVESDMAQIAFSGETGSQNPMFARAEWGVGDFYFASNATLNLLEDLNDPRGTAFFSVATTGTLTGQLRGIDQGTIDDEPFTAPASDYSGSSPLAYSQDNAVVLMSPWEVWFLRAEAAARYSTSDDEAEAFNNAIQANFDYLGVTGGPAYISSLGYSAGAGLDAKIDMIAEQKYISLNGTQEDEGWIETRRFDRPASRLFSAGIFQDPPLSVLPAGQYPASWLYPASERSLNPNAPAQRTITEKIFWDN